VSTTQAQAAVMESTARRFEQAGEDLAGMLSRLLSQLEGLRQAWQGAGGRSFEQVKQAWARDQRALHSALEETAAAVRTSGRRYEAADAAAADRVVGGGRGGLDLPL
jgi:WXG100 family type VII secretion target